MLRLVYCQPAELGVKSLYQSKRWCDRTGTIIAWYLIAQDHWADSIALREAEVYGLSPFEVGMRNYVKRFKE